MLARFESCSSSWLAVIFAELIIHFAQSRLVCSLKSSRSSPSIVINLKLKEYKEKLKGK